MAGHISASGGEWCRLHPAATLAKIEHMCYSHCCPPPIIAALAGVRLPCRDAVGSRQRAALVKMRESECRRQVARVGDVWQ